MTTTLSPPPKLELKWTDYPLMDAALAGLCVYVKVPDPALLTPEHFQAFQKWAEDAYFTPEMSGWISVVFTSNFINYSFTPEKRREVLREILSSYQRPNLLPERCAIFRDLPAQQRVARDLMPMLMGRGPMNFYPDGQPGLPLSGQALAALQGLALAAPLVSGRALILDADDRQLLLRVVATWQEPWLKRISLSKLGDDKKPIWAAPRTRLIESMRQIMRLRPAEGDELDEDEPPPSFQGGATIYYLTNSGQGPDAQIYSLGHPSIQFLRLAEQKFPQEWRSLLALHAYKDKTKDPEYGFRNEMDEALFSLPDEAAYFLRRYLLPPFNYALKAAQTDGKKAKTSKKDAQAPPKPIPLAGLWGITELLLLEVVGMEKARVEAIRGLADRLSYWINFEEDLKLFKAIYAVRGSGPMRNLLLKASFEQAKDARPDARLEKGRTLITEEEYRQIFLEQDEVARADFTLARDLLKMRVLELMDKHEKQLLQSQKAKTELEGLEPPTEEGEK